MRIGKLNVVKGRKTTDSEPGFSMSFDRSWLSNRGLFDNIESDSIELISAPAQTNQQPVTKNAVDEKNISELLGTFGNMMESSFYDDFWPSELLPRKSFFPIHPVPMKIMNWKRFVHSNRDPITEDQMNELIKRFRFVHVENVRENFSKNFADFLIKAIDHYHIDVKEFILKSDAYVPNAVGFEHYDLNFQGDVQEKNWNEADTQFVILHELRHIMQYLKGWLQCTGDALFYKGQRCIPAHMTMDYNTTPCEYDANRFTMASPLWTKQDLCVFWSIPLDVAGASEAQYNRWNEYDG